MILNKAFDIGREQWVGSLNCDTGEWSAVNGPANVKGHCASDGRVTRFKTQRMSSSRCTGNQVACALCVAFGLGDTLENRRILRRYDRIGSR